MNLKYIFFTLFTALFIAHTFADDHSNARFIGMSHSGMLSSFGVNAFGINPANYYYSKPIFKSTSKLKPASDIQKKPQWEVSVFSLGGTYGCDSNMNFYNTYLGYLSINRETFTNLFTDLGSVLKFRDSILPNNKTDVNYDFELKWFSVNLLFPKIAAFNFTISDKVGLNTEANSRDEYLPLNFQLIPEANGKYSLTNVEIHQSEATAWWLRKYSIGASKVFNFKKGLIKNISIGFSAGLVHGFGNVNTFNSDMNMNTYGIRSTSEGTRVDSIRGHQSFYTQAALTDYFRDYIDGAETHFTFFPKPAGKGYSFDFGINLQIGSYIWLGASATDLGKITWDYNTFVNYDNEDISSGSMLLSKNDPNYNIFVNDLEGLDTRDTLTSYETDMPAKFRAGILYKPSEKLLFELNWKKGNNNLPGNTTRHIIAFGTEYIPYYIIPLRTGISIGGPEEFKFSLGAGLRLKWFEIDFAADGINNWIKDSRISMALSTKIIY